MLREVPLWRITDLDEQGQENVVCAGKEVAVVVWESQLGLFSRKWGFIILQHASCGLASASTLLQIANFNTTF